MPNNKPYIKIFIFFSPFFSNAALHQSNSIMNQIVFFTIHTIQNLSKNNDSINLLTTTITHIDTPQLVVFGEQDENYVTKTQKFILID